MCTRILTVWELKVIEQILKHWIQKQVVPNVYCEQVIRLLNSTMNDNLQEYVQSDKQVDQAAFDEFGQMDD